MNDRLWIDMKHRRCCVCAESYMVLYVLCSMWCGLEHVVWGLKFQNQIQFIGPCFRICFCFCSSGFGSLPLWLRSEWIRDKLLWLQTNLASRHNTASFYWLNKHAP